MAPVIVDEACRGSTGIVTLGRLLADLADSDAVGRVHPAEALSFRRIVPEM
jgi:predicted ATPase with chaperone activity